MTIGQRNLSEEPNIVSLRAPMTISGYVSGELENLLEIFHLVRKPPVTVPKPQ